MSPIDYNQHIEQKGNRIHYIDIAKGILILFVVYDHLPDVYMYLLKLSNYYIELLDEWQWIFKLFFMPAFFCITGMCSNFNKNVRTFLLSNVKTLIFPNIIWGLLLGTKLGDVILHGGAYWFLSALFVSKMLYYCIIRISDKALLRFFILLCLVFIGFSLNGMHNKYDIWYFHYALCLCIFLEIGKYIRLMNDNRLLLSSVLYVFLCICMYKIDIHKPIVALGCSCKIHEVPLYILSAFMGSCMIVLISKMINTNKLLEFFGKESLLFYIFQIKVMLLMSTAYLSYYSLNSMSSVLLFLTVVFIFTIIVLSIISLFLETKSLRFLIGKF